MTNHPKKGHQSDALSAVWWFCLIHNKKKKAQTKRKLKRSLSLTPTIKMFFRIKILVDVKMNMITTYIDRKLSISTSKLTILLICIDVY